MPHKSPSDQELAVISQRCDAATAGPLGVINQGRGRVALCLTNESEDKIVLLAKFYGPKRIENASFAAHAHEDVRRLLHEIKRLRTLLAAHKICHTSGEPTRVKPG